MGHRVIDKMGRLISTVAVFATVALGPVCTSWADQSEAVDVVVFELQGTGVDEELRETLTAVLRQEALQHRQYSLANPAAIQRDEVALVVGCDPAATSCLRQMGEYVEGQVLIFGEVERRGHALVISVDILDVDEKGDPVRVTRVIEGSKDPVMAFRREVETIFDDLVEMGETHLVVEAPDDETPIKLEDVVVATGKFERRGLRPGSYRISVGEGEAVWSGEVDLVAGHLVELRPEIPTTTSEPDREPSTEQAEEPPEMVVDKSVTEPEVRVSPKTRSIEYESRRSNLGAYSLMTVGATALAVSGVMVFLMRSVEEQIRHENEDGTMTTSRYQELVRRGESYQVAQYVLLSVGAAALASGAGWAIWNHSQNRADGLAKSVEVEFRATPISVGLSGRW